MTQIPKIIRSVVNKSIVPKQPKRRGRKGYGVLLAVRLLIYMLIARILTDKGLVRHLQRHRRIARMLGFKTIPHRTTTGRWKKRYWKELQHVFVKTADIISMMVKTKIEVIDSTPLEDPKDPDAKVGFTPKGVFKGFKVHIGINQIGAALRAIITAGNEHDSPHMPKLIVKSDYILGDAGYDSESNREAIRAIGAEPVIATNPRNTKPKKPRECIYKEILKKHRYLIEQFNSLLKEVLNKCWQRFKGIKAKCSVVYAALISINLNVLWSLLTESEKLRTISRFWH